MKIITWNCNGAFRKKLQALEKCESDIMIIQECENPAQSTKKYKSWAGEYLWIGENKNKGIGVFPRSDVHVELLDWPDDDLQSFLPCKVNESFSLLAVWTKYANSPNSDILGSYGNTCNSIKTSSKKISYCCVVI